MKPTPHHIVSNAHHLALPLPAVTRYVQARGRARKRGSAYVFMAEAGNSDHQEALERRIKWVGRMGGGCGTLQCGAVLCCVVWGGTNTIDGQPSLALLYVHLSTCLFA